ncbi:hypothetical protein PENSPDRAFT_633906 [Peniophora sp. CONT]|nr:hypothetical protein PENSPDRAFT_633906 [Peniophora sp. CONT]
MANSDSSDRLPRAVRPTHYDLIIRTDLLRERFFGRVRIHVDVLEPTNTIELHAAPALTLQSPPVFSTTTTGLAHTSIPYLITRTAETQRLTYTFVETFKEGTSGVLEIMFEDDLAKNFLGYYKCPWSGGVSAATQFEPVEARSAFPCFDEPALKATFAFTSITREGTVSLANMPIENVAVPSEGDLLGAREDVKGWVKTVFQTTPPMSSYIVAYANGAFVCVEGTYTSPVSKRQKPIKVWTTEDLISNARFTLDVASRALPAYEALFGLEMPLPKMDILAVGETDVGAMENWGLIISAAAHALAAPGDKNAERESGGSISHELAHQWFGNATTMAWWDSLFLNEGFATWIGELVVLDTLFPEWGVEADFIHGRMNDALRVDAQLSSHPVQVPIEKESRIMDVFDSLSYGKAASVLRMLAAHLGQSTFLKGVALYLKRHEYGNAEPAALWAAIGETCAVDVAGIVKEWIEVMGFPVVSAIPTATGIDIRQDRFLSDRRPSDDENNTIWTIPLALVPLDPSSSSIIDHRHILSTRTAHIDIASPTTLKFNANTSSFFRVHYTPSHLRSLLSFVESMSTADALGLIQDAGALAAAGLYGIGQAMDVFQAFGQSVEYAVQRSLARELESIERTWWDDATIMSGINALKSKQFGLVLDSIGYDYDSADGYTITQLRTLALSHAAMAGEPRVVKLLQEWFEAFIHDPEGSGLSAGALSVTLYSAVRHGDEDAYDSVFKVYKENVDPAVHKATVTALGASQHASRIDRTIDEAIGHARANDVPAFLLALAKNAQASRRVCEQFLVRWDEIDAKFGKTFSKDSVVLSVFSRLSNKEDIERVKSFFETKDTVHIDSALRRVYEEAYARAAWSSRSTAELREWLERADEEKTTGKGCIIV